MKILPDPSKIVSGECSSTDGSQKPSEWIRQKRTKASIEEAAREIQKHLDKWHAQGDVAKVKWVWELIQNARDVAKKHNKKSLEVSFVLDENQLVFEHDAGPFSLDDIYSLVNGRSSKPLGSSEMIGQFGKGFIVTHIVSGKARVKGWLRDDTIRIDKTFEITLDRSIRTNDELTVTHIANNIKECSIQLDNPGPPLKYDLTQFEYPLSEEGRDAATTGLSALGDALPFVLAFTEPEMTIRIVQDGHTSVYRVTETEPIQSQPIKIQLLKMAHRNQRQGDGLIVASLINSNVRIAVPCSSTNRTILELGDTPQLFKMYPLAKTEDLALPVVIDAPFKVSAERFDLQYRDDQIEELKNILQTAMNLLKELCKWALDTHIPCTELLFKIKAPPNERPYEAQWAEALSILVMDISQLEAVEAMSDAATDRIEFLKPDSVYFPSPLVGLSTFVDEKFISGIWYLSRLLGLKVPARELIKEWNLIRECWKSLGIAAGNEQTFESLVKQTHELRSLVNLKKKIGSDRNVLAFLKYLYKLGDYYRCKKAQVPEFLKMAVYCNQNGDFKRPEELNIDENVPDALKKISADLFEPLRGRLLNTEFSEKDTLRQHFQTLGLNIIGENKAIGLLYDSIHRNWKQRSIGETNANKYKRGVMEFEKWLLQKKNIEPILEKEYPLSELPFLCEDNRLRIVEKEYFVLPDMFLEKEAREHTKIWPNDTKLSKEYSKGIANPALIKNRLVAAKISQPSLIFSEETDLSSNQMKELSEAPIRGTYMATAEVSKVVAFDKVLRFAEQSRNLDLTKAILGFLLGYVVPRENSWQELKKIRAAEMGPNVYSRLAPTGKKRDFHIYHCLWLAQMKSNKWVVTTSVDDKDHQSFDVEQPSKKNLTDYLKTFPPSMLGDEKVHMFLQQKFEFSPLEMTSWLLTGGKSEAEQALVESLKQIYELADSRGLNAIYLLNNILLEKQRREQFNRRNVNFGLSMERAVRKVFEEQLKYGKYDFEVIPRWKGYDFEAYLGKQIEESDYGTLLITVQRGPSRVILARFEIEVKATRVDTVTMTLTQANNAVDHAGEYLLCVVDAKEISADFADLDSISLSDEEIEKLSEKILPLMNIVSIGKDLRQVVVDFRKASSATPDIKVDYNARFIIPSKLWKTKGKTVTEWFISVLHELGVSTN